ncbi:SGNH/GDSL hydrolase family protein [Chitinispirillales bacterium ANBcel5]|uniref:SGNH/GDSL hydrolase family protein n=1 Tax=Cellulosispirillum alkaliphilum TaxID=3039283 RepID=UPI002A55A5C4|nr:SGNH/GDSL hydrolase family protein [Chitinispirillales bacterium ANBcel5]
MKSMFFLLIAVTIATAQNLVSPSDPAIRYWGRFEQSEPDVLRFDWPGFKINTLFEGTSCAIRVRGDGELYNVFINDSLKVVRFEPVDSVYLLAQNLSDTVHSIRITNRFESRRGAARFYGFILDDGKQLHAPKGEYKYRIEYLGGSNLLGFGNESTKTQCENHRDLSNSYLSFGPVSARLLGAEYHLVALSGKGVVRNWAEKYITSKYPFGHYYNRTLRNNRELEWDFSSWIPHVVVISLGTNDFSTQPHPPKSLYKSRYSALIDEIRSNYPDVGIVCMTSSREPLEEYVSELVEELREAGDERIAFYSFGSISWEQAGCDWHPNIEAHREIAQELARVIKPLLPKQ